MLILLLGALGLVNIAMVTVRGRIREIGVRRSFGATAARVFVAVMLESVVATVVAFWAYLTLLGRIGGARAGYATVMFPVFALLVSTVFEGYHWTLWAVIGLGFVAIGNVLVIRSGKR